MLPHLNSGSFDTIKMRIAGKHVNVINNEAGYGQTGESFFEIMTKIKNGAVTLGRFIAGNSRVVKYVFAAILEQIFMANKFSPRYSAGTSIFFHIQIKQRDK